MRCITDTLLFTDRYTSKVWSHRVNKKNSCAGHKLFQDQEVLNVFSYYLR